MKKIDLSLYLVFISFLTLLISNAQCGWVRVGRPGPPWPAWNLEGIYFKDINTGVCTVFKTINGGQSWYQTSDHSVQEMFFINENTGFSVGYRGYWNIAKTTNLGDNWTAISNPASSDLFDIFFLNTNTGYACGQNGSVVKTTNGGINWFLLAFPVSKLLSGIYFTSETTGYIVGIQNGITLESFIAKTTNGGSDWSLTYFPNGTVYKDIYFTNTTTGIVVGYGTAKTTDAGGTWVPKTMPPVSFVNSMHFPSQDTGYAVGFAGSIIKTTNTGESWFQQSNPPASILNDVYFINNNTGYACGAEGIVLKTTDGGGPPVGIKLQNNEVPNKFALFQNYPNPFNPISKIKFQISKLSLAKLVIYDILGREVTTLVNEELTPGKYIVEWNASNYPSGIYFYELVAGDPSNMLSITKRMVLIK